MYFGLSPCRPIIRNKQHTWSPYHRYYSISMAYTIPTNTRRWANAGLNLDWFAVLLHLASRLYVTKTARRRRKWNESGFRPPLCTYRLNWARRASWGWWDDTVLQTQDSKFEPWRSKAENATSRSRRLPTILTFTRGWGRNIFVSFKPPRPGTEPQTLAWKAAVLTTTLGPPPRRRRAGKQSRLNPGPALTHHSFNVSRLWGSC